MPKHLDFLQCGDGALHSWELDNLNSKYIEANNTFLIKGYVESELVIRNYNVDVLRNGKDLEVYNTKVNITYDQNAYVYPL